MKWVWTWGGISFGYLEGENLWTFEGKHVGKLRGGVIYGADGRYLGELRNGDRLITRTARPGEPIPAFTPYTSRPCSGGYANLAGREMPEGYEDFPPPEAFA